MSVTLLPRVSLPLNRWLIDFSSPVSCNPHQSFTPACTSYALRVVFGNSKTTHERQVLCLPPRRKPSNSLTNSSFAPCCRPQPASYKHQHIQKAPAFPADTATMLTEAPAQHPFYPMRPGCTKAATNLRKIGHQIYQTYLTRDT